MTLLFQGYVANGSGIRSSSNSSLSEHYLLYQNEVVQLRRKGKPISIDGHGLGELYSIASGIRSLPNPELSAEITIRAMLGFYENAKDSEARIQLSAFVLDAHRKLLAKGVDGGIDPLGSCFLTCWLKDSSCHFVHVGDLRLYHWSQDDFRLCTRDHSCAEFAQRNNSEPPGNPSQLAQAFMYGSHYPEQNESLRLDLGVDVSTINLKVGDRLIMCSPGLHRSLSRAQIRDRCANEPLQSMASSLFQDACNNGSTDNITVIAIGVQ